MLLKRGENIVKFDYHVIVIGAGSGGLTVASGAVVFGAKVALIEHEKMGGDCLNTGCVPSKAFLKCAHLAKDIGSSSNFAIESDLKEVSLAKVMDRVHSIIEAIEPHDSKESFENKGVDVLLGKAKFIDRHTIDVDGKTVTAKNIVIATGSAPVVPKLKGLDEVPFLTNLNIFDLKKLPKHLIVLGGGPVGLELGQGFRFLGSEVTIIDRNQHLFAKDDPEAAPVMEKQFSEDGIRLILNAEIKEVAQKDDVITVTVEQGGAAIEIQGDHLLVSLGRTPASGELGLENAGVDIDKKGFVTTNDKMQTNIKNIYACGDVTGAYLFTHMAGYQASIVLRNMIFHLGSKVDYSFVPWTTYTKPEVAHVGYTEPWAKKLGLYVESIKIDLSGNDRAIAQGDTDGFIKLILGKKGRVIGATVVSEYAGEMIPIASLAIKQKLSVSTFFGVIFSYPTESEAFMYASLERLQGSLKGWQKKLIKEIFLK